MLSAIPDSIRDKASLQFIKDQEESYGFAVMENRKEIEKVSSKQVRFFAKTTMAFNKHFVFRRSLEMDERIMVEINIRAFKMINVVEEASKKSKKPQKTT